MAKVIGKSEFGKQLCEALGFDPKKTGSIELTVKAHELVRATVVHFLDDDEANSLLKVVSEYTLHDKQDVASELAAEPPPVMGEGDALMRFFKGPPPPAPPDPYTRG